MKLIRGVDFDQKFCDMFASYINFSPFIKVLRDKYYQSRLLNLSKSKNRTRTKKISF